MGSSKEITAMPTFIGRLHELSVKHFREFDWVSIFAKSFELTIGNCLRHVFFTSHEGREVFVII